MSEILITGATGTTGNAVTRSLIAAGLKPRIGVRDPARSRGLADLGAEPVRFRWDDSKSYAAAFAGVRRAFLLVPFVENFHTLLPAVLLAAKDAGVEAVVKLSAVGADPQGPEGVRRWHGLSDRMVAESGLTYAIVRPTFFQDNLVNFQGASIRDKGEFYGASSGGKVASVSSQDIGDVAAKILEDPGTHHGKAYDLTGPEALSDDETAALVTEIRGAPVRYVDVGVEALAASLREAGAPAWRVQAMVALEQIKASGWAAQIHPGVTTVLGRPAERFGDFIKRRVDELR